MLYSLVLLALGSSVLASDCSKPVPYEISVDPKLIEEAKLKAKYYRPSVNLVDGTSETWIEGPPAENMTALAEYWAEEFDWYKFQDELNANSSHYYVTVPGGLGYDHPVPLHFVHERSARADATPLLLLHGWPSSHQEWSQVVQPLVSPDNNDTVAFHVVAPDMPGYGFSPAAAFEGFGPRQAGKVFGNLMRTLGYSKYGIATTDAGWYVGLWMVNDEKEQLVGHFTDFWMAQPNSTDLERFANNETDAAENTYISSFLAFENQFAAYMSIQSQSPLKVGQALTDSPVGFAGWIWHHDQWCSDGYAYSFDEIITQTMMLWIPGAYGNIRTYTEYTKVST